MRGLLEGPSPCPSELLVQTRAPETVLSFFQKVPDMLLIQLVQERLSEVDCVRKVRPSQVPAGRGVPNQDRWGTRACVCLSEGGDDQRQTEKVRRTNRSPGWPRAVCGLRHHLCGTEVTVRTGEATERMRGVTGEHPVEGQLLAWGAGDRAPNAEAHRA